MEKINIRTHLPTVPLPLVSEGRGEIRTERLILRPLTQDVLEDMHSMRAQPEVMAVSRRGVPDKDLAETQELINPMLPPNDATSYRWVIYEAHTGDFVGSGGVASFRETLGGWPEIGYMLKKEHWGKGYATEFLGAWLEAWWKLPRSEIETKVLASTIEENAPVGTDGVQEVSQDRVAALIEQHNISSQRVVEKCGFRRATSFNEPSAHARSKGTEITVFVYVATAPASQESRERGRIG